jgi:membrane-associated phospholipid phosphatase
MNSMLAWGAHVIAAVQTLRSPPMDAVMKTISLLGAEYFFLAALPFLYWCLDERRAIRLAFATFFNLFVNIALKDWVGLLRPYQVRPQLRVVDEIGFSFPSWHAQGSAAFWVQLSFWIKRPWGIVLGLAMPLAIGFTRVYLGVHYPTDVLAGWAIGASIALCFQALQGRAAPILAKLHIRFQIAIVAAISWLMCFLHMADVAPGAGFFGVGLGYALNRKHLRYSAEGGIGAKALRFILGGAVLGGIYVGLKLLFPKEGSDYYTLFRFLRYGLLGLWTSFGAPWLFIRLKLAGQRPEGVPASADKAQEKGGEPGGTDGPRAG